VIRECAIIVACILIKLDYNLLMPAAQTVAAHFAMFAATIERITRAKPSHDSQWQHSAGKAARDIVQDAAEDLGFGDDPAEVATRTAAKLAALEAA